MISYIVGEVRELEDNKVIVEVSGVGYEVFMSYLDIAKLSLGVTQKIYIYRHVYENEEEWYGFLSKDSKEIFVLLTKVNNVGPKLALRILSSLSPTDVIKAISTKNVKLLSSIKGVGEKVAERIVSELKNDILKLGIPFSEKKSNLEEIIMALKSLGYNHSEITKMISIAREKYENFDYMDVSEAIQICLSVHRKA